MKIDSLTLITLFFFFFLILSWNARNVWPASCPSSLDPLAGSDLRLQTARVIAQFLVSNSLLERQAATVSCSGQLMRRMKPVQCF